MPQPKSLRLAVAILPVLLALSSLHVALDSVVSPGIVNPPDKRTKSKAWSEETEPVRDEHENPSIPDATGVKRGLRSRKNDSFFREIQKSIDSISPSTRCPRYRTVPLSNNKTEGRRIFYGSLIAEESWELLRILAAESYGIYHAMVLVESNRTQNFTPRPFRRTNPRNEEAIRTLFGVADRVMIRPYVNEDPKIVSLVREHDQRKEILLGWKELGMRPDDIGLLADMDESFTRDFLRAAQECDIPVLDYNQHFCHHSKVKIIGQARVFEASPECVHDARRWLYPGMVVGQCLEHISDPSIREHPKAPRQGPTSFRRQQGWGARDCNDWKNEKTVKDFMYPLFNAADYRKVCAGSAYPAKEEDFDLYTAFHFHNFFPSYNDTRHKHLTYGHSDKRAGWKPLNQLGFDNILLENCVKNVTDDSSLKWRRVVGGIVNTKSWWPVYFHDPVYREERHTHVQRMIAADEVMRMALMNETLE